MNFLNSAILAGLAAALAPLLIHLLNRRRVRTVEFSSVMFLRDLRKTRMRRLQLRRWLLLLIRTAMVAFAVLAFARPALKGGIFASLGARAHTTAVVALDRSASMALETANGPAYERAQSGVRDVFAALGEGDDAILLPFTHVPAAPVPAPSADFERLNRQAAELPVTAGSTDAGAALIAALEALAKVQNLNREVYVISDMQREAFVRTVVPPAGNRDAGASIYVVDVSDEGGYDFSVDEVSTADQLIEVNSPFLLRATVANQTAEATDHLLVSLFLDGRRVAQQDISLPASGRAVLEFSASVETPGVHSGFVEVSADDNPLNNRRHVAITIPGQIRVLLSSDYPGGRTAARLALSPRSDIDGRVRITEVDTDALLGENFFDYDCILITEWRDPASSVVEQLVRFSRAGGGVFVAPSVDADTTAWNSLIAEPYFGLRVGDNPPPPNPERFFTWDRYDWQHPIWSVYRDVRPDRIPEIRWYSIFRTIGTPQGESIVEFSGGRPSLSEIRLDLGKMIVLWSSPNAPYTDLPLRSSWVPFVNRLTEYLAADLSETRGDYMIGAPIVREPVESVGADADIRLAGPDGLVERPGVEWSGRRIKVRIPPREIPGVYTLLNGERAIDAFAVNLDPAESSPERIDENELRRRWDGYNIVFVEPGASLAATIEQARYGTEIRGVFLWAVMGLFLLEMLVARTRRRDMPLDTASTAGMTQGHPVAAD